MSSIPRSRSTRRAGGADGGWHARLLVGGVLAGLLLAACAHRGPAALEPLGDAERQRLGTLAVSAAGLALEVGLLPLPAPQRSPDPTAETPVRPPAGAAPGAALGDTDLSGRRDIGRYQSANWSDLDRDTTKGQLRRMPGDILDELLTFESELPARRARPAGAPSPMVQPLNRLVAAIHALELEEALRDHVTTAARQATAGRVVASPEADTVLEVGVSRVVIRPSASTDGPVSLLVTSPVRLVRRADGRALREGELTCETPGFAAEVWLADDADALARALAGCRSVLAAEIAERLLPKGPQPVR